MNIPEMGSERIGQEAGLCLRYLKATKEVLNEGASVGTDGHVAVELSEAELGDLSPVFTNVLLPQVELQSRVGDEVKWLWGLGPGALAGKKGVRKRYLGGEVSPLGSALVMEGDSLDPTKDDVFGNLHAQTPKA